MARARVLLLDDDPTIRFFVGLALADLPVDLVECAGVDEAVATLRAAPCQLLLTDLVLRTGSGFDLLQLFQHEPALRADARVVVFSAALTPEVHERLRTLGVWRLLAKPASLADLQACVQEGLSASPTARPAPWPEPLPAPGMDADEDLALQQHFGGDLPLFMAFRGSCEAQFGDDRRGIDEALARDDAATVQRTCHSLKTVLLMLGRPALAARAKALDSAAQAADRPAMDALWPALRDALDAGAQPAAERPSATGVGEGDGVR